MNETVPCCYRRSVFSHQHLLLVTESSHCSRYVDCIVPATSNSTRPGVINSRNFCLATLRMFQVGRGQFDRAVGERQTAALRTFEYETRCVEYTVSVWRMVVRFYLGRLPPDASAALVVRASTAVEHLRPGFHARIAVTLTASPMPSTSLYHLRRYLGFLPMYKRWSQIKVANALVGVERNAGQRRSSFGFSCAGEKPVFRNPLVIFLTPRCRNRSKPSEPLGSLIRITFASINLK